MRNLEEEVFNFYTRNFGWVLTAEELTNVRAILTDETYSFVSETKKALYEATQIALTNSEIRELDLLTYEIIRN